MKVLLDTNILTRMAQPAHTQYQAAQNAVDALVYTDIGMDPMTYSLAFSRLAPVQCTTWGHPDTTGLKTIDYFLSSQWMETAEANTHYSEPLVRLPSLSLYFDRSKPPPILVDRAAFGLSTTARLYVCPQSIFKFHPDFDEAIASILRHDHEAQLVLIRSISSQATEQLRGRFSRTMPDVAGRIVFLPHLEQAEFFNLLLLADVVLDPFPYCGGISSLEAFSLGVPVVTLPTEFLRGRFTQAFYRRLGIESCIARNVDNYIEIALRLGTDLAFRKQMHDQIIAGQPRLFEDEAAIRDWEEFLRWAARDCYHTKSSTIGAR